MNHGGMTPIVKNTARLVSGFIAVFGIYIALTGHLGPGGGFAGGVILAAAAVLIVLAFGSSVSREFFTEGTCHVADSIGAAGFLVVGLCGFFVGSFFTRFLPQGTLGQLASGGAIPLANLAILIKVAAGLAGAFVALASFRLTRGATAHGGEDLETPREET